MKNVDVDNSKIAEGQLETKKVIEHYVLTGWIAPCLKCGTWLTSLGLCPECGIRYELAETSSAADTTKVSKVPLDATMNLLEDELRQAKEFDLREYEYWTGVRWQLISPHTMTLRKRLGVPSI